MLPETDIYFILALACTDRLKLQMLQKTPVEDTWRQQSGIHHRWIVSESSGTVTDDLSITVVQVSVSHVSDSGAGLSYGKSVIKLLPVWNEKNKNDYITATFLPFCHDNNIR